MDKSLLPKAPSTNTTLLKYSLSLYRASFSRVIIFTFLLSFITFIPRSLSFWYGENIFIDLPLFSPHRLWFLLLDLIGLTLFVGMLWRMHCLGIKKKERFSEDLKVGARKSILIFIASLLQSLIVAIVGLLIYGMQVFLDQYNLLFLSNPIGTLLISLVFAAQVFLIFYITTLFLFMIPIIATENKGILFALERSIYLTWNHWWRIFSLQIIPWLVFLFTLILLRVIGLNIHIYFLNGEQSRPFIATLFQLILFALFIPWVAALLLVQLKDLELRKHILRP